jgi:truncated hemoglobin YjbI
MTSHFDQLGGEPGLRGIVDDFVDRVFDDIMIGFHFRAADRARIKAKEYEFAAQHLGADVAYSGQPMARAHAKHGILGGQFVRRLKILEETLEDHGAPPEVIQAWLAHNERLRGAVTKDAGSECNPPRAKPLRTTSDAQGEP